MSQGNKESGDKRTAADEKITRRDCLIMARDLLTAATRALDYDVHRLAAKELPLMTEDEISDIGASKSPLQDHATSSSELNEPSSSTTQLDRHQDVAIPEHTSDDTLDLTGGSPKKTRLSDILSDSDSS